MVKIAVIVKGKYFERQVPVLFVYQRECSLICHFDELYPNLRTSLGSKNILFQKMFLSYLIFLVT